MPLDTNKTLFLSLSSAFVTDAILAIWQLPQSDRGRLWWLCVHKLL